MDLMTLRAKANINRKLSFHGYFELYSQRMNKGGIITVHDTDRSYVDNFTEIKNHEGDDLSGPSKFVKTIDKRKFEVFNLFNHGIMPDFPSSTGLTIVRRK